jgi:hypothetical protein
MLAGVLGLGGLLFTKIQDLFPIALQLAMPGRFINLMLLAFPAVFIGTTARYAERPWARLTLGVLFAYPLLVWLFRQFLSSDRFGWDIPHFAFFNVLSAIVVFGIASQSVPVRKPLPDDQSSSPHLLRTAPAILCIFLLFGVFFFALYPRATGLPLRLDPALEHLRQGEGMIVAPSATELLQLRTGRPVLVNTGALDQLPYVPASAMGMREILLRVYGVDLLEPPSSVRELRPGALPPGIEKEVWEARTRDEWIAIAEEFDAWTVLARNDVALDLPVEFVSDSYRVYSIPTQPKNSVETP